MKQNLLIIITSPDRPGIVEQITDIVVSHGGNWEESRMARLCGDFAGIVRVSVSEDRADVLAAALQKLADEQTSIIVKRTREEEVRATADQRLYRLQVRGADHEGIVHRIAAALAGHGMNIEKMETAVAAAATTGTPVFQMDCLVYVSESISPEGLQSMMDSIGDEMAVDIDVAQQPSPTA